MKNFTAFLIWCALSGEALSQYVTIFFVPPESGSRNCIIINGINKCNDQKGKSLNSQYLTDCDPIYFGFGLNSDCHNVLAETCVFKSTWGDWVTDHNLHRAYFRADQCLWTTETGGAKIKDDNGKDMCLSTLISGKRCKKQHGKNPFYDQAQAKDGEVCSLRTALADSEYPSIASSEIYGSDEPEIVPQRDSELSSETTPEELDYIDNPIFRTEYLKRRFRRRLSPRGDEEKTYCELQYPVQN